MIVLGIYNQTVHGAYRTRKGWVYKKGRKKHLTLYAYDNYGKFFTRQVSQIEGLLWKARKRRQKEKVTK